ncbi:YheC/YheD family protein [Thalassorhabdus alkalitolerans]|uniref:YheC/YheD family protein n=1 Tax=Thalassorhabdus alkalitolerans TaxID=2282697 RepID=A0ABW0YHJ5_9BACI
MKQKALPPAKLTRLMRELEQVSIEAAEYLDRFGTFGLLGELSIDFALDKENRLWIIEANGQPQKKIITKLDDEDSTIKIYKTPLEYGYYLFQNSLNHIEQMEKWVRTRPTQRIDLLFSSL